MPLTAEKYYGGGSVGFPGADTILNPSRGRSQTFEPQSSGLSLTLPPANNYTISGGPFFKVFNAGAFDMDIEYPDGTLLGTISPMEAGTLYCSDISSENGQWHLKIKNFTGPSASSTPPTPSASPSVTPSASPPTPTASGTAVNQFSVGEEVSSAFGFPE